MASCSTTCSPSDYITQAEYDAASAEEIVLAPPVDDAVTRRRTSCTPCARAAADLLGDEQPLDSEGLRIITTLDYNGYQVPAEKWTMSRMTWTASRTEG